MWTREEFVSALGRRAVIGMIHLRPLPASPLFGGSMQEVIAGAIRDARAIADGGGSALLFENFGDRPFRKEPVDAETVSAMTAVIGEVKRVVSLPFGVNVLRNDGLSALAIAEVTGARFIRVNVHAGAMLTDQGIIEGRADALLRRRRELGSKVAIFADHLVKHATPLAPGDPLQMAKDLRLRGMADAIVVSGRETGSPPDAEEVTRLCAAVDSPVVVGSGVREDNVAELGELADGVIIGTSIKEGGVVDAEVRAERLRAIVSILNR